MGRILVVGGERSVIEKRIPLLLGYVVLVGFFVMRGFLFRMVSFQSLVLVYRQLCWILRTM